MKELSIEEKAKRYDKLFVKASRIYNKENDVLILHTIEDLFPELKESEDEKIRKELIRIVDIWTNSSPVVNGIPRETLLAWFEKQDEQKKSYDTCDSSMMNDKKSPYGEKRDFGYFEEKPVDKVEQKFKVGNWYLCVKDFYGKGVRFDKGSVYYCKLDGCLQEFDSGAHISIVEELYAYFRLWTIQDAKDGDVLSYITDEEDLWIMIYRSLYEPYDGHVHYHALFVNDNFTDKGTCCICIDNLKPATKEQRDLLFQKMKEAGYEWDAEKKELKKIEQKPVWSEEDESLRRRCIGAIDMANLSDYTKDNLLNWLKFLKDRYLPQSKQEWNEEDEKKMDNLIQHLKVAYSDCEWLNYTIVWLKSLRPQLQWKPSDEQIKGIECAIKTLQHQLNVGDKRLNSLYDDLKKLKA